MAKKAAPPQLRMLELLTGHWIAQALYAITRLGVPDAMGTKAVTATALAKQVGAHPDYLRRVLRALGSVGVVAEDERARFRLTELGQTLRSGRPGSLADFALMIVADYNYDSWTALLPALQQGTTAFDLKFGRPIFDYLREHPEDDRQFSASMASISGSENGAIAKAYPFGRHATLVDVGGAHGHLLATILRAHRKLRGILFDQPQVVASASSSGFIDAPGVRARCTVAGGSFFESVPPGADAYLMKYIIHDWDAAKCVRILANCRDAMATGGRVLVVDRVIRPGNAPDWSKWLDINMMVGPGGQERTRTEFEELFKAAGLKLVKLHATGTALSILEAARA